MKDLIKLFVNISLLKSKPQDLPTSEFFAVLLAVINLVGGALVVSKSFGSLTAAFQAQLLDVVLVALLIKAALQLTGKSARFYQTISALYGTGILINLVSVPLMIMTPEVSAQGEAAQGGPWALFYLILVFWTIAIGAHILRHTFEIPFALGVAFSVSYFILIINLIQPLVASGAV